MKTLDDIYEDCKNSPFSKEFYYSINGVLIKIINPFFDQKLYDKLSEELK